jgi:hypothetical protein
MFMKNKIYIIFLVALLIPFISCAQVFNEYGVKLAFTQANVYPKEKGFNTCWRSGLMAGFFAEKDVYKIFYLQTPHFFTCFPALPLRVLRSVATVYILIQQSRKPSGYYFPATPTDR